MLLAVILGITLGITGTTLIRQWLDGALVGAPPARALSPVEFPRLAPPARPRTLAARPTTVRRAA